MRLAVARDAGLDEAAEPSEAQQVALRLADALLTQPGAVSAQLRADLARHYRPEQVLELTLDVMKWSYQKVPVALRTDDEVVPGALTDLRFDADGTPRW